MEQQMSSLGKRLIKSAKEARTIARGEADASTYKIFVPAKIDVKAIRARRGLTQGEFCIKYGLSIASLRDWEQGRFFRLISPRRYATPSVRKQFGLGMRQ